MSLQAEDDEDLPLLEYEDLNDEDDENLDLTGRFVQIEMPFHGLPSERFLFDFVPGSVVNFVNQTWEIEMNTEGDSFTYLWLYEILQMTRKMIGAVKYRISLAMNGSPKNELDKLQEKLEGRNCPDGITSLQETYKWSAILIDHFIDCEKDRMNASHDLVDLKMLENQVKDITVLVKNILINKLVSCLPIEVPYTALTRILDHLMDSNSRRSMLGFVTDDNREKSHLANLTITASSIYYGFRSFMFFRFLSPDDDDNWRWPPSYRACQAIHELQFKSELAMRFKSALAKFLKIEED